MPGEYKIKSPYLFPLFAENLFCGLTRKSLDYLDEIKRTKRFEKGARLFAAGAAPVRICILREGRVRLLSTGDVSDESAARLIKPGEIFGLTELIANQPYELDAEALAPCLCECIEGDDFIRFLRREPEVCFRLLRLLGSNLQKSRGLFFSSIN